MKRSELKELLLDLGVDAEVIKSIANPLVSAIGEKNNALLERKKTEWESSLPKSDELVTGKLKELGFDGVDSIKGLQEKYKVASEKLEATEKAEKDKHFNTTLLSTLESFNIDSSKSTLISKLMAKDDLYTEDGEINSDYLNEQVKATVTEYLPELVIGEPVQEIPDPESAKPESIVDQARRLRGR